MLKNKCVWYRLVPNAWNLIEGVVMALKKGRQINHSDTIDLDTLESIEPNKNHRQMLKYRYRGRRSKKIATVVLMNPSSASKEKADNTIRRVEDIVFHLFKRVGEVRVFNLFTVRGMNPKDVNELYTKKGLSALLYPETDDMLEQSILESEFAIAAWGGPCGLNKDLHAKRVEKTHTIFKQAKKVYRIAGGHYAVDAAYPLHGRLWSYSMKAYSYKF